LNKIIATLKEIKGLDNINLLTFELKDNIIKVLILQRNMDLKIGQKAVLSIKPTKLFLSNKPCDFENVLKVKIKEITKGELVSLVNCDLYGNEIEVMMLSSKVNFKDVAYLMFKACDISILEIIND